MGKQLIFNWSCKRLQWHQNCSVSINVNNSYNPFGLNMFPTCDDKIGTKIVRAMKSCKEPPVLFDIS